VLIFGGHTDTDGPNTYIELLDLSSDCYLSKYGKPLALPDKSDGGKIYFPPTYDPVSNKLYLIFGYCDEPPYMEEIEFGNFMEFHRVPRTISGGTRRGSVNAGESLRRASSITVLEVSG